MLSGGPYISCGIIPLTSLGSHCPISTKSQTPTFSSKRLSTNTIRLLYGIQTYLAIDFNYCHYCTMCSLSCTSVPWEKGLARLNLPTKTWPSHPTNLQSIIFILFIKENTSTNRRTDGRVVMACDSSVQYL
jgi:hypothetical protein